MSKIILKEKITKGDFLIEELNEVLKGIKSEHYYNYYFINTGFMSDNNSMFKIIKQKLIEQKKLNTEKVIKNFFFRYYADFKKKNISDKILIYNSFVESKTQLEYLESIGITEKELTAELKKGPPELIELALNNEFYLKKKRYANDFVRKGGVVVQFNQKYSKDRNILEDFIGYDDFEYPKIHTISFYFNDNLFDNIINLSDGYRILNKNELLNLNIDDTNIVFLKQVNIKVSGENLKNKILVEYNFSKKLNIFTGQLIDCNKLWSRVFKEDY